MDELSRRHMARIAWSFLQHTSLVVPMIQLILKMAPRLFVGTRPLVNATASIFAVHIHQNRLAIILTRAMELYILCLKTGKLGEQNGTQKWFVGVGRPKTAAFHPVLPVIIIHSHTNMRTILRYPVNSNETQVRHNTVRAREYVQPNGLSMCKTGVLMVTQASISLYTMGLDFEDSLIIQPHTTLQMIVKFARIISFDVDTHELQFWCQTKESMRTWPIHRVVTTPSTRKDVWFYGPTNHTTDVRQISSGRVVATTQRTVYVWEADGSPLQTFRTHFEYIQSLGVHLSIATTASFDRSIRVWDLKKCEQVQTDNVRKHWCTNHKKPQAVCVNAGFQIIVGYDDRTIEAFCV